MNSPLVLAFDCGTQSLRAMLFNKTGDIEGSAVVKYPPHVAEKFGYAEQKAENFSNAMYSAARQLKEEHGELWQNIKAVSVTTIRDTYVCVDAQMNPLRPVIMWHDQREAKCEDPLPVTSSAAFHLVGMNEFADEQRKITKANWIRENEPEIWAKTHKYLPLTAWFTYLLTGNVLDSVASQAGHIPFDFKNKKWMEKSHIKYPVFETEKDKMPELREPCTELGRITAEAAEKTGIPEGLPVIASGSDKGCESLGSGCISSDMASISFGTAASIQLVTSKYVEPQLFLPAYPAVVPNLYNPEIQVYRGFWMVEWFINELASETAAEAKALGISTQQYLNKMLEETSIGADGLILQPYWGAELKKPEARGAIIGFTDQHTKKHIYRAIIEGINFDLMRGIKTMEHRSGIKVKTITVSGGGAKNDVICQLTADMFGRPIKRIQTHEASGLGCAIAAFIGIGEFGSFEQAIQNMVHYKDCFMPDMEAHRKYEKLYNRIYKRIYPRLQQLYKEMNQLKDIM